MSRHVDMLRCIVHREVVEVSLIAFSHNSTHRRSGARRTSRRRGALALVVALLAGVIVATVGVATAPPVKAVGPGNPGVPSAPVLLYDEGFENGTTNAAQSFAGYVGVGGDTITAGGGGGGGGYSDISVCNGVILTYNSPMTHPPFCNNAPHQNVIPADFATMRAFALILGQLNGTGAANHAVADLTAVNVAPNTVELATGRPITLPAPITQRFVGFSINLTADCGPAVLVRPVFQFNALLPGAVNLGSVDTCARLGGTGTLYSSASTLFTGTQIGFQLINVNGGGIGAARGNDAGFDDFKVLDETPQLDKSFDPSPVGMGSSSTLTFTITNTVDRAAKNGWSFTDTMPAGLVLQTPTNAASTCPGAVITAADGGTTVAVTGNLATGMASCTVTVDVTSPVPGTFTNCAANVTEIGLNPPGCDSVIFVTRAPFACTSGPWNIAGGSFNKVAFTSGVTTSLISGLDDVNGIGYDPLDGQIWGWDQTTGMLVRFNPDNTMDQFPSDRWPLRPTPQAMTPETSMPPAICG
jgi:uncharacterized repeat protein (TIGR01451 family)